MEDREILVDTSVLIDFLRKAKKDKSFLWHLKNKYANLSISAITVFELFAGATDKQKIDDIRRLLKWIQIIGFDEGVAEISGELFIDLKSNNQLIDFKDIFIAATAIFYGIELATLNVKHFARITNLRILKIKN